MGDALVGMPFLRDLYDNLLDLGGPDVGFVYGAPNAYEGRTRVIGAQSDAIHNYKAGNEVPEVLVVPEDEQESVDDSEIELLEDLGCEVQEPDIELSTTADDIVSGLGVAGEGDVVHGFTSDYHGPKCHTNGWAAFNFRGDDNNYRTFAFGTDICRREKPWIRNVFVQTVDIRQPVELYKWAKQESNF